MFGGYPPLRRVVRGAGHHCGGDIPDMAFSGAMNVTAENSGDPPRVLQSAAQSLHDLRFFEVQPLGPDHDFERRMVCENRNRLAYLGISQVDQPLYPRGAKVASVAI